MNIMLDLETLDSAPMAAILSIGAVAFTENGIEGTFYARVTVESAMQHGTVSASTLEWWLKQSNEARAELTRAGRGSLPETLEAFSNFVKLAKKDDATKIWGNGADFDNVVLASAYRQCSLPLPWEYRNNRCYRTMKAMYPQVPFVREGTHHNALDDAATQALHLIKIFKAMKT